MKISIRKKSVIGLGLLVFLNEYYRKTKNVLKKLNQELTRDIKEKDLQLTKYHLALQKEADEREKTLKNLINVNSKLRDFSSRLQQIQEEERIKIAREIHDELGQRLTVMKINLSWLNKNIDNTHRESLQKTNLLLQLVDETIQWVKKFSTELRPSIIDDLGLIAALEWQTKEFENQTHIKCILNLGIDEVDLDNTKVTVVFRIFQEALTNVARHSQASLINIKISIQNKYLLMSIKDNGKGISDKQMMNLNSFGILGMKERARDIKGELSIYSEKDIGTTVKLKVPLSD